MTTTPTFPDLAAFRSKRNNKYLQYVNQVGDLHSSLRFSGDQVVSPYTKFHFATSHNYANLVHLRSLYNRKYFVVSSTQQGTLVLGESDEPLEDKTMLSCTLFEPIYADTADKTLIRLLHVNLQKYIVLTNSPTEPNNDACLCLGSGTPSQDMSDVFTIIDWSTLVILPKHVAFKSGAAGKYLSARKVNGKVNYLEFVGDDLSDPTTKQEVVASSDEYICLKSNHFDKFWSLSADRWIVADGSDKDVSAANKNILFSPTPVSGNDVIALKSLGNNCYCKSVTSNATGVTITALGATDAKITELSQLGVVDYATSRSVNVEVSDFHVSDNRVTKAQTESLGSNEATNPDPVAKPVPVILTYTPESWTSTWSSNVNGSLKDKVSVGIKSPVPVEDNEEVKTTDSFAGDVSWGEAKTTKSLPQTELTFTVTVPAGMKVTVTAQGSKKLWDIPFSYTQTNTLADGTTCSFRMDDGFYAGTHSVLTGFKVELSTPTPTT